MPATSAAPEAAELIDLLYAALFSEAPWQDCVDRSCDLLPNGKTVLFFHDKATRSGAMSLTGGLDPAAVRQYDAYYHRVSPWVDHAIIRPLGRVTQADEMLPRAELKRTEYFQDYLRPQDIETGLGVTLHRHDQRHVFFSIVCADVSDERLDHARRTMTALAPHLDRALRMGGAVPAGNGGDRPPSGGTLQIDARLRVVAADSDALALVAETEALAIGPMGRLTSTDPGLLDSLKQALRNDGAPAVRHLYIRRRSGPMPLYLCMYRPGQGASADSTCFVRIEDPAGSLPAGVREFCTLHGLTEAEAGIVAGIAEGLTLAQIAARRRRSQDTVRTQVKTIFWKTGCTRQAEIIRQVTLMSQQHERPLTAPFALPALTGKAARPRSTRS